jgi:hypothetical protein
VAKGVSGFARVHGSVSVVIAFECERRYRCVPLRRGRDPPGIGSLELCSLGYASFLRDRAAKIRVVYSRAAQISREMLVPPVSPTDSAAIRACSAIREWVVSSVAQIPNARQARPASPAAAKPRFHVETHARVEAGFAQLTSAFASTA